MQADVDSTDFADGALTFSLADGTTSDAFSIELSSLVYSVGGSGTAEDPATIAKLTDLTTTIATYVSVDGTSDFVVELASGSDADLITAILQGLKFANSSDNPSSSERTLSITLTDGDGGTSSTSSLVSP